MIVYVWPMSGLCCSLQHVEIDVLMVDACNPRGYQHQLRWRWFSLKQDSRSFPCQRFARPNGGFTHPHWRFQRNNGSNVVLIWDPQSRVHSSAMEPPRARVTTWLSLTPRPMMKRGQTLRPMMMVATLIKDVNLIRHNPNLKRKVLELVSIGFYSKPP